MARVNYQSLIRVYEAKGAEPANQMVREAFRNKHADPRNVDFGALFAECFGWHDFHHCRSTGKMASEVMEAAGAVMTTAFQGIAQQAISAMTMDAYESPEFIFTRTIPERQSMFSFEKIPGISELGDEVSEVAEGESYPLAGVTASYMHMPETKKRGFMVQLTREAIFFDKTGLVQTRCAGGGKSLGQNREKRAVDCVIDENGGAKSAVLGGHRYHFRGNSIATYGNSSGNHDWDNLQASNALVDPTDIDAVLQLFNALTDPDTGEPIVLTARHLVVAQGLEMTARNIRDMTKRTIASPGFATSGNPIQMEITGNGLPPLEILTSPYVAARLATDTDWFFGDLAQAFEYIQNWAPEVKQIGAGTQLEFEKDIVQQYRFSEYGNYGTKNPRKVAKASA